MSSKAESSPIRILLVEDNPGDARLLRELISEDRQMRTEVIHVEHLAKAFEVLASSAGFDVILLDLSLPDARGLETVIKTSAFAPSVPIVVLTGLSDEELALSAVQHGAQDYLVKGLIDGPGLGRALRYAIERSRTDSMRSQLLAERAARAQAEIGEKRFRGLAEALPQIVWEISSDGVPEYTSPRWFEYTGLNPTESPATNPSEWIHPDHLDDWRRGWDNRTEWQMEYRLRRPDGTFRWHLGRFAPLLDAEGRLAKWYATATDIDDRKRAEEERIRLYEAAQRAIKSRDDLLATVSHDLRSPLGSIVLGTEVLLGHDPGEKDAEKVRHVAMLIRRSAKRMEVLIRDLLDIASIESGHLRINPAPILISALVQEVMEAVSPEGRPKRVRIQSHLDMPEVLVHCDKDRMLQVFANLIGNAVKFTPEGGSIIVGAQRDGDHVRFSVSDTGKGIAEDQLTHVFDRFWQADEVKFGGVGLGLAICRGIIEQHRGKIWVESTVGQGTTFSFTLPIHTAT
ncbi:MAG: ATP-binding protein [Minicystis sp.]